ncbi:hypothetical protein G5B30_09995 [Sphingobacterium sp. SGG-5]|uniref:right-handed parallel beta-helix repeat-containing protein n=1 Tax=Sphingobacterium sp. SGG-5 TaxID=2710881 RepID=UPI0013EC7BF0|nr:right-handed parallel beta-helix repeat-containing protein [Sphingobacterium sp. SGG-5]NGM62246.1 hypothetical protein [Sphingobacterium sp. SGG-5]
MFEFKFRFTILICALFCTVTSPSMAIDVKDFGAQGDGKADDTDAIIAAITGAVDGHVEFTKGQYKISRTIEVKLGETGSLSISGAGGTGSVIMTGEGPAFRFIGSHEGSALPSTVKPIVWEKERMPTIYDLEIVGAHQDADGLEFRNTMQPTVRGLLIRDVRTGVHLVSRNRNIIIADCHIYNASGIGIFLDQVNIHQFIISNSHISYCKQGGIKVAGGNIRNFQITGNDIEYNCDPEGIVSADIWIDCSKPGSSVREGTISGNTIQAIYSPNGANIRFIGQEGNPRKIGLWSITGNHISAQDINIHLQQTRGINITGNSFIRGFNRNIVIENSENIVVGNNVMDRNEDYYSATDSTAVGGVSIANSRNIIFSSNILEGAEAGNEQAGGALTINNSRHITINNNQITDPKFQGIHINNSAGVMVSACMVTENRQIPRMLSGILVTGSCPGTVIRGNRVDNGKSGRIKNKATGAIIE